MVDNFGLLRGKLNFEHTGLKPRESGGQFFYYVQIMRRRKDVPSLGRNVVKLNSYYITSMEQFDALEGDIKKLCDEFHARAYINLNRRSYRAVSMSMLNQLVSIVEDGDYATCKRILPKAAGKTNSEAKKYWVI